MKVGLFRPLTLWPFPEEALRKAAEGKSRVLVAILYLFFFSYSTYMLYPNLTKRGDWARVAAFIEQTEKPNQPIMVFLT